MKDNIEITYYDTLSAHGEQVVHNLLGDSTMPGSYSWPEPDISVQDWQTKQVVVAKADGVVAGRAVISNGYYPFLELENLVVDPAYRGQGVGSRLVDFAIKRAAEAGYLAVHLQTDLDNRQAHKLYAKHGFLPTAQGEMLRMIRFLSYPALNRFRMDHPLALLKSEPGEDNTWKLHWTDPISHDSLSILLSGGSCQGDSDGYGPGVAGFEMSEGDSAYSVELSGPGEVNKGSEFEVRVKLNNRGRNPITGACRLLLNSGFEPVGASSESQIITVAPNAEQEVVLGVRLLESFNDDTMKVLAYRSTAVVVEFLIDGHVFWLSHEVKPVE